MFFVILYLFRHMGISILEPERGQIEKVKAALKASLAEQGYKA